MSSPESRLRIFLNKVLVFCVALPRDEVEAGPASFAAIDMRLHLVVRGARNRPARFSRFDGVPYTGWGFGGDVSKDNAFEERAHSKKTNVFQ